MMIVLLITAILLSLISSVKLPSREESNVVMTLDNLGGDHSRLVPEVKSTLSLHLVLVAILLGCAQMTNYWDFLIYFIYSAMALLIVNTIKTPKFVDPVGIFVLDRKSVV